MPVGAMAGNARASAGAVSTVGAARTAMSASVADDVAFYLLSVRNNHPIGTPRAPSEGAPIRDPIGVPGPTPATTTAAMFSMTYQQPPQPPQK